MTRAKWLTMRKFDKILNACIIKKEKDFCGNLLQHGLTLCFDNQDRRDLYGE